ncbi:MAG: Na+/H+ antiporter NhaC family protein, partial [Lachnospiraceae bacterium]
CMAGAVCGDHCSPISDTTIMSSAGAQCNHMAHVSTQIPYALLVAGVSAVSYIFSALMQTILPGFILPLVIAIVLMVVALLIINAVAKSHGDR